MYARARVCACACVCACKDLLIVRFIGASAIIYQAAQVSQVVDERVQLGDVVGDVPST